MPAYNGTLILLQDDGTPFSLVTDATLNVDQDLPDSSSKDSAGWADHVKGQRSWSVDVDGRADFDSTDTGNVKVLFDYIDNRSDVTIEFEPDTASADVTGSVASWTGTASLANVSITAPNEDTVNFSGSFTGNGALTLTVIS